MNDALVNKLRLTAAKKPLVLHPPYGEYMQEIGLSPEAAEFNENSTGTYDFVQLFVKSEAELVQFGPAAIKAVDRENGMFWICYPKGTSKIKTDINRDRGWNIVTAAGFQGIASIAIDETWSALRFRPADQVKSAARSTREKDPTKAAGTRAVNLSDPGALVVPDDLAAALVEAPEAAAFFEGLAPYGRKEYIRWINEAKRAETRSNRITVTTQKLKQGIKAPHLKA